MEKKELTSWRAVGIGAITGFVLPFSLAVLVLITQGDPSLFPVVPVAFIMIAPFSIGGALLLGKLLKKRRQGIWVGSILGMFLGIGGWILILNSGVIDICPLLGC